MVNENVGRLMAERVVSIGARSTKRRISEDDGRMRNVCSKGASRCCWREPNATWKYI